MPKTGPFDKYSDGYDRWFDKNRDLYLAELEAVRELMPDSKGKALEVGVGTGRFAAPLGIKVGVEPSEPMAARATKRGIDVCAGVAEDLPFRGDRFDVAAMITSICFFDDVIRAFTEALRVVKPEGCLIVGFVDKQSELGRRYADRRENSKYYREAEFLSAFQVLRHLKSVGFTVVKIRQTLIPGESAATILDGHGQGGFVVVKAVK